MTGLQEKLLELLCEIDEICKKHGIEYMLFAGTALGAERHHGFIPWDDDADVIMTLDNYTKFVKVAPKELKENRALNCLENNTEGYFLSYARYVNTNTTAIQRHTAFGGCDPGVKVDIFCAVPTYEQTDKAEMHKQHALAFAETICKYGVMYTYRNDVFFPLYHQEQETIERMGRQTYIEKSLKTLKKRRNWLGKPKKYILLAGIMSNSYVLDAELLDKVKYVPFENTKLPISVNNIAFNKALYGEGWINIPDNIEQPRHTMLLDLEEPFSTYLDLLKSKDTYEKNEKIASERRKIHLEEREMFRDVMINRQSLTNLLIGQSVMNQFVEVPANRRDDWKMLYELFQPYYSMQLHRSNRFHKLVVELDGSAFHAAITAAIVMGRYDVALDILNLLLGIGYLKKEAFAFFYHQIEQCIQITEEMYLNHDLKQLNLILTHITDSIVEKSITVVVAKLWIEIQACHLDSDYNRVIDMINEKMDEFGNNGELLALKGFCLEKLDRGLDAKETYQKAIKHVRNAKVFQQLLDGGFDPYEE